MATSTIIPPAAAKTVADLNTALDGKKFYNSVTELGLTAGSATLTDTWNAMANNSMGVFSGSNFPVSELPGTQTGIVIIHKLLISRGVILWAAKNQTDGTKNQLCVMQWSNNAPSGVWRDIANLTAADVEAVAKAGDTMTGSLATPTPLNITSPSGATRSEINFGRAGQSDVPNKRAGVLRYDLSTNQWKFLQVTSDNTELDSFYLPATDLAATSGSAYGIFTAKDNARTGFYQLGSGGGKCTLTLNNNVCMFAISRAGTTANPSVRCVCVAEYWSSTIAVFGELPSQIVLQKSSNSNVITIQNNRTTGVVLTCVSGIFAAVDGTDAITSASIVNYAPKLPLAIDQGGTGASGTENLSSQMTFNTTNFTNDGLSSFRRFGNVYFLHISGSVKRSATGSGSYLPIVTLQNDSGNNLFPPFSKAVGWGNGAPLAFVVRQGVAPDIQVQEVTQGEAIELTYTWIGL